MRKKLFGSRLITLGIAAVIAAVPALSSGGVPVGGSDIVLPDIGEDTLRLEPVSTGGGADTTSLFEKVKKSKVVRDFPTLYEDTTTFSNGTFVFRALLMKKFWRKLSWLSSRERPTKNLPDSITQNNDSVALPDTVPAKRSMVTFISPGE